MAENRCVVTLNKGVDTAQFCEQMTTTYGSDFIPNRNVELVNEKTDSISNFDFVLTEEEFQTLKNDPRVRDIRWGSKAENGFERVEFALEEEKRYYRNSFQSATDYDWAKPYCTTRSSATRSFYRHAYTLTGKNVDVIINDSGAYGVHPEFADADGNSRLIEYDWTQHGGSQIAYSSYGSGHGVHVAGTTLGKLYGWAKDANYYFCNYNNTGNGLNQMRLFHLSKGNNNPTIVNQSWGYIGRYSGSQYSTTWRGTEYVVGSTQPQYGQMLNAFDGFGYRYPSRVTSVDSDQEDLLAAGVIVVGAAGNYYHKIDVPGGVDYDNYFQTSNGGTQYYYHRGSSPVATPGTIAVGNIDSQYNNPTMQEQIATSTEVGPRVDIFAPGTHIQSAIPRGSSIESSYGGVNYPGDSNYDSVKISGTSMASPQVCGVLACLLEARPHYTAADCLAWLQDNATTDRLYDPTTGTPSTDYQNSRALQGAPNYYLYTPFIRDKAQTVSGAGFGFST